MFLCERTKLSCVLLRSLQKNVGFFGSFTFFAKERCVLFLSLEKNRKEGNVLLGLRWRQKLKKERKRTERTERKRTQCPTLASRHLPWCWFLPDCFILCITVYADHCGFYTQHRASRHWPWCWFAHALCFPLYHGDHLGIDTCTRM